MRSLTVTCLNNQNYGGVLQAYALHTFQKKLGIDNVLLNTSYGSAENKKQHKFPSRSFFNLLIIDILNLIYNKRKQILISNFNSFVKNHIKTTKEYISEKDLQNNPPNADFYITGSDQVITVRGPYASQRMLQFGKKNIKRYSYAGSIADINWSEEEKNKVKSILSDFRYVSLREKYAKNTIESFCNINTEVNIDPVFLLSENEWNKLISPRIIEEDYILCYPLIGNNNLQNAVDNLKAKTGLKICCVQNFPVKRIKADKYIYNAGPAEFLNLFKYSRYVITTSFHGTAFSLIFNKPFYTLIKNMKSQRITDLLNMVNLSDRIYNENIQLNINDIDFSYCNTVIEKEKERSLEYFKKIINDVENN